MSKDRDLFQLPKKINILGKDYKVEQEVMSGIDGKIIFNGGIIFIDPTGESIEISFIHECLHAVLHRIGARETIDDQLEESLVETIATFFHEKFYFKLR